MTSNHINRRTFLQSLGVGAFATISAVTPAGGAQEGNSDSNTPTFGSPIEQAFNNTTEKGWTALGSINERALFVGYQSWNEGGTTSTSTVAKLNRFTGDTKWARTIDDYIYYPSESDGRLYFAGRTAVHCWDAASGDEIWSEELNEDVISVGSVNNLAFAVGFDLRETPQDRDTDAEVTSSTIYAFDPATGELLWNLSSGDLFSHRSLTENLAVFIETSASFTSSGLVFDDGQLTAFDKSTGDVAWESASINPDSLYAYDDVLFTRTTDSSFYVFDSSGDEILYREQSVSDYFITEELLLLTLEDGGIRIFDHNGVGQADGVLYPEADITGIRSGQSANTFVLKTNSDRLIAIDGSSFTELSNVAQPADSIVIGYEMAFVVHDTNRLAAINLIAGETVWQDQLSGAEALELDMYDGLVYISGEPAPLRAYHGRRGRALASLSQMEAQNSLSGTINGLLPGPDYVSQARNAFEQGDYEQVHELLASERQRRLAITGVLGATGLSATYGGGRIGASKWRRKQFSAAVERLDSKYPIETGELAGLDPTELLAQGRVAEESLESRTGVSLRQALSANYGDLQKTLNDLADRHKNLVSASMFLDETETSLQPDPWADSLRAAVEEGDIERIDTLLDEIQSAKSLLDELQSLSEIIGSSSFSVSADQLHPLLNRELTKQNRATTTVGLSSVITAVGDGIEAIDGYQGRLSSFDLNSKRASIQDGFQSPLGLTASTVREIKKYPKLFEAAEQVEKELAQVDFDAIGVLREEFEDRAQAMFASSDIEGLHSLADTLEEMREGRWSHSDLFSVSPTEFEYLIAALFADMGYQVAVTEQQGDKGVDIIARNAAEVLAIQVKQHSRGNKVGRPTVQQVIGAMAQAGADQAVIVSSAGFTRTATEASRELGSAVELIDGDSLVQLLTESSLYPESSASTYRSEARSASTSSSSSSSQSQSRRETSETAHAKASMNKEQAYDILHISPPATQSEITAQYRERVKDAHPDTGGSAEEFKRVNEAYTVLSE